MKSSSPSLLRRGLGEAQVGFDRGAVLTAYGGLAV
jgi:hypothetical protein